MGPWGIAAIALLGATTTDGGRKLLRSAAKSAIRAGLIVKEKSSTVIGDLKEQFDDVIAEVKAEVHAEAATAEHTENGHKKTTKAKENAAAKDED